MIGDWVSKKGFPFKIEALDMYIHGSGHDLEYDAVEPIPLVPEILEKNGLRISDQGECFEEDEHCMVEISVDTEGIKWTVNCHEYCIMTFRYVHELQNALRLAGVKKEIEL